MLARSSILHIISAGQVRKGIELVDNDKGTLIVIMRYTGDVLLFVSDFVPTFREYILTAIPA